MIDVLNLFLAKGGGTPTPPSPGGSQFLLLAIMGGFMVFMVMNMRSQRKREERQRQELYNTLAKNHRVVTSAGIIGTVVNVKDNEVVLKVDDATNTKMTFLKTAVVKILTDGADLAPSK